MSMPSHHAADGAAGAAPPATPAKKWWAGRANTRRIRTGSMLVVGVAAGIATGFLDVWRHAPAVGWAFAAGIYDLWIWTMTSKMDAAETALHATEQDPRKSQTNFLTTMAALISLAAVGVVMVDAHTAPSSARLGLAALALGTVALSWMMIHLLYMQRYADIYYTDNPPGGIDFNQEAPPRYTDFAYVALTFGTVYAVSDTVITSSEMRNATLRHTLLSFIFANGILASTINLVVALANAE
ncbi:DUF1345 domain-containing protein [Tsukamurella pulmonis]|uniref:DUF1345 domain-containing protein n=1 Tax=Tsukamurella pulmonis TaxID=47312 RepID=UPI000A672AF7|nr:DUF1345 domain-containing protein [Tsukamurella pulmonis]